MFSALGSFSVAGLGPWFETAGRTCQELSINYHSFNLLQDTFEEYQSQVYDVSPEGTQVPFCFQQYKVVHPYWSHPSVI